MRMDKPLISIIIPVYKVEKFLDRCLKSVVNQTYKNLEIILIDDGSPDRCPEMCDFWAEKDNRIKVIHKKNAGVSAARNDGLAVAKGDLIGFVDSDDVIHPSMYEEMVSYLVSQDCDLVSCGYSDFSEDNDVKLNIEIDSYSKVLLTRDEAMRFSFEKDRKEKFIKAVWTLLIRASIARSVKFDCSLTNGEDIKFSFEVLMKANRVGWLFAPFYMYYQNKNGAVASITSKKQVECINVFYEIYLTVCTFNDKALKKEAYLCFLRNFSYFIFGVEKKDLRELRGLIFKNIFGIIRSPDIYWKEKILIILKLF
ncbi:MAG TPA: hypothetical protein DE313_08570 [Ruminococcus sp.]|nr:hypothetical protein [Ruminococcus sp.]